MNKWAVVAVLWLATATQAFQIPRHGPRGGYHHTVGVLQSSYMDNPSSGGPAKGKYSMTNASWKTTSPPAPAFAPPPVAPQPPVQQQDAFVAPPAPAPAAPKGKYSMTNASWKTSGSTSAVAPTAASSVTPAYGAAADSFDVAASGAAPVEYGGLPQAVASMPKGKYSMTNASWKTGGSGATSVAPPATIAPVSAAPAAEPASPYAAAPAASMPKGKYAMTNASWKTSAPASAPATVSPAYSAVAQPALDGGAAVASSGPSPAVASMPKGRYSMTNASWKTSSPATAPASSFTPSYSAPAAPEPVASAPGPVNSGAAVGPPQAASMPKGKYSMTNASWKTSSPATAPASSFTPSYSASAPPEPVASAPGPVNSGAAVGPPQAASMPKGKYSMTNASWKTSSPASAPVASFTPSSSAPAAPEPVASAPGTVTSGAAVGPPQAASMPNGKYSMTNASWKTSSPASSPASAFAPSYTASAPAPVQATSGAAAEYSGHTQATSVPKGKYSMTNASWKTSSPAPAPVAAPAPSYNAATPEPTAMAQPSFDAINGESAGSYLDSMAGSATAAPKGKYSMTSASWKSSAQQGYAGAMGGATALSAAPSLSEPSDEATSSGSYLEAMGGAGSASPPKGQYSMTSASWKTNSPPSPAPAVSSPSYQTPAAQGAPAVMDAEFISDTSTGSYMEALGGSSASAPKGQYSMTSASWKSGASGGSPKSKYSMTNASWKSAGSSSSPNLGYAPPAQVSEPPPPAPVSYAQDNGAELSSQGGRPAESQASRQTALMSGFAQIKPVRTGAKAIPRAYTSSGKNGTPQPATAFFQNPDRDLLPRPGGSPDSDLKYEIGTKNNAYISKGKGTTEPDHVIPSAFLAMTRRSPPPKQAWGAPHKTAAPNPHPSTSFQDVFLSVDAADVGGFERLQDTYKGGGADRKALRAFEKTPPSQSVDFFMNQWKP